MSRSRRKHSIAGVTAAACEKQEMRHGNRALWKATRQVLGAGTEASVVPVMREIRDEWNTAKEGKLFSIPSGDPKRMRKRDRGSGGRRFPPKFGK